MASGFLVSGGAAASGWTEYPPLSGGTYSGTGTDLWIMGLTLIGTSSILGAINFLVTIFKMRAPGMTLFRMPILTWTVLVTSVLVLMATPVLTSALIMLFIDRNYGGHFFDPANGGNAVLYQNIFWFYSHPAVYIMVLPAMGIISEVLPVFSRKPLFGYKAFVFATVGIGALGFSVWAHHMFTTGAVFLPFFSLMTFLIAVPTGVKMFNWIATMWRGQLDVQHAAAVRGRLPDACSSSAASTAPSRRPCRSTSRSTTPTGSSPTSTTSCSAGRCSASSRASTTGSPR